MSLTGNLDTLAVAHFFPPILSLRCNDIAANPKLAEMLFGGFISVCNHAVNCVSDVEVVLVHDLPFVDLLHLCVALDVILAAKNKKTIRGNPNKALIVCTVNNKKAGKW